MVQSEFTNHSAGHSITLQYSLSEERTGLVSAEHAESSTTTVSVEDTFGWQIILRVRVPWPQVLEQGVHSVTNHLSVKKNQIHLNLIHLGTHTLIQVTGECLPRT